MDLAFATARDAGRRPDHRQRPGRRPPRRRHPRRLRRGGFRRLSGNEVGALLGWRAARLAQASATSDRGAFGTLACSIVSSPALAAVARGVPAGLRRHAHRLQVGLPRARARLRLRGGARLPREPGDRPRQGRHLGGDGVPRSRERAGRGGHAPSPGTWMRSPRGSASSPPTRSRCASPTCPRSTASWRALRAEPPARLGDVKVAEIDDLADGFEGLPPSDVLRIRLEDGSRVMVRPSGTEPKLKIYIDAASRRGLDRRAPRDRDGAGRSAGVRDAHPDRLTGPDRPPGYPATRALRRASVRALRGRSSCSTTMTSAFVSPILPTSSGEVRITWASDAAVATVARSDAVTSASMSRRRSTRSALTLRMPDVPMPAPQMATIFTGPPPPRVAARMRLHGGDVLVPPPVPGSTPDR